MTFSTKLVPVSKNSFNYARKNWYLFSTVKTATIMEVYFYKNLRKLEAVAESDKILSKERKNAFKS